MSSNLTVPAKNFAGVAQLEEQLTCNEKVEGSIPFTGTNNAGVAQLVELLPSKQNVEGSSPFSRSKFQMCPGGEIGRRGRLRICW